MMDRPLRIAVFLGCFPVVSETFVLHQITGLLDRGNEVDIYADVRSETDAPVQPEVAVHRLLERTCYMDMPPESAPWEMPVWPITGRTWVPGETRSTPNWLRVVRATPALIKSLLHAPRLAAQSLRRSQYNYQAESFSVLYRLAALCSVSRRYDVLHAHFGPAGNSYRFAKRLWRAPLVVSFHGYDFSRIPQKAGRAIYRQLFQELDLATVSSDYAGEKLKRLGCPSAIIRKLAYGIDMEQFPYCKRVFETGGPVRILTVGRMTEKKGLEFSIRAFAKVRQRHPHITYDIVGDGPLRPKLERLIEELKLSACVTLYGARTKCKVRQMLSQAHIFILASVIALDGDQEGTPVALLEAQASGLPVLSTRHGGIPEIVRDGETGFLLPERDSEALAERLTLLIEHPETCVVLGRNGHELLASQFDSARQLEKLMELYRGLLKAQTPAKCR